MMSDRPVSSVDGYILSVLKSTEWNESRKKLWHLALVLGAAYAATKPHYAWAFPALTAAAGLSEAPFKKSI